VCGAHAKRSEGQGRAQEGMRAARELRDNR
jgi:hypothetical protein